MYCAGSHFSFDKLRISVNSVVLRTTQHQSTNLSDKVTKICAGSRSRTDIARFSDACVNHLCHPGSSEQIPLNRFLSKKLYCFVVPPLSNAIAFEVKESQSNVLGFATLQKQNPPFHIAQNHFGIKPKCFCGR